MSKYASRRDLTAARMGEERVAETGGMAMNVELSVPKIELSDSECKRYEARADEIAASEPIEVMFAIAAKLGFVDGLGGGQYRSWAEEWMEEPNANESQGRKRRRKMTITKYDPEKLSALLEVLGFSMSEFFNDDGSLKSHVELAGRQRSLPYTLADFHYQLTTVFKHNPPAERFGLFVQLLSDDGASEPVHQLMWNFLLAIVGSINAGEEEVKG